MKVNRRIRFDHEAIADHLLGLSDTEFEQLIERFAGVSPIDGGELHVETGGYRSIPGDWRQHWTTELLSYREKDRAEWLRLCHHLSVIEDDARKLHNESQHLRVTQIAAIVAAVASLVTVTIQVVHWIWG